MKKYALLFAVCCFCLGYVGCKKKDKLKIVDSIPHCGSGHAEDPDGKQIIESPVCKGEGKPVCGKSKTGDTEKVYCVDEKEHILDSRVECENQKTASCIKKENTTKCRAGYERHANTEKGQCVPIKSDQDKCSASGKWWNEDKNVCEHIRESCKKTSKVWSSIKKACVSKLQKNSGFQVFCVGPAADLGPINCPQGSSPACGTHLGSGDVRPFCIEGDDAIVSDSFDSICEKGQSATCRRRL